MTAQHVPGPYITENGYILAASGQAIAKAAPCRDFRTVDEYEATKALLTAAPTMLAALQYAQELIGTARQYFPKSIRNHDTFQLENTCATIGTAIAKATGGN